MNKDLDLVAGSGEACDLSRGQKDGLPREEF